jgi:hypothetical protein
VRCSFGRVERMIARSSALKAAFELNARISAADWRVGRLGNDPYVGVLLLRDALRWGIWRERCGCLLCRLNHLAMIIGHPLGIVREFGEASFEPLKLTHLVRPVSRPHQFGIFDRFGSILLSSEHRQTFCERSSFR